MKIFIAILLLAVSGLSQVTFSQVSYYKIKQGPNLPGTCNVNSVNVALFYKTTAPSGLYVCTSLNVWTILGSGSGGAVDSVNGEIGVVVLDKADIGLANVDNTSDASKPISTATQTGLNGKQPINSNLTTISGLTPTTDNFIVSSLSEWASRTPAQAKTSLSLVKSDVGLSNVDNTSDVSKPVSTSQQTALNLKANLASPTFTGTVGGITKSMVGLGSVDNTSDASKPVSTAQQTALDLKANIASPTFTGTVSGITKSMVGLASVDNTTDASKPVSTAQQTALDLKANLASPTFTGTVSGITKSMVGLANVDNTSDSSKPVSTAQQTALDLKANLASPTFSGTVGGITKTMVGLGSVDNTSDASKPVSTAQQTALNLKANIASPTFTGTVSGIDKTMVGLGNVQNTDTTIASNISSGLMDGDRLPGLSTTKKGGVPATGTPSGKFLKDDGTWVTIAGGGDLLASNNLSDLASIPTAKTNLSINNVDNTSDANKPVSTAQQTALDLKANLASPTFTGTVNGITKSMVGLANVDNTSDVSKPVSTAQQTALDLKVNLTSPYGYALPIQALTSSPADAATIYFGMLPKAPTTTANISKVYIRKTGTIKIANIYCFSGTAGSAENWSLNIRLNNTTDTLIATVGAAASERVFVNTSLSIAVVAGDYIEIKAVNPTWATNPLTTIFGGYLYIE